jgi:predicted nucleotidyltransferase
MPKTPAMYLKGGRQLRVDTSHRGYFTPQDEAGYNATAARCVREFSVVNGVVSVVLCGSLAKGDLIPGWSDVDIIVFVDQLRWTSGCLSSISDALRRAVGDTKVGIGLDVVEYEPFRRTEKLCGRPYMMTYEVAGYGIVQYGLNAFDGMRFDGRAQQCVDAERPLLIASELDNWRRTYLRLGADDRHSVAWLFECAKSLLRLLQCETGPNLVAPMSCAGSLTRLEQVRPEHPAIPAFREAVAIRHDWDSLVSTSIVVNRFRTLEKALIEYPVLLPDKDDR